MKYRLAMTAVVLPVFLKADDLLIENIHIENIQKVFSQFFDNSTFYVN